MMIRTTFAASLLLLAGPAFAQLDDLHSEVDAFDPSVLAGTWVSSGYTCETSGITETVEITVEGNFVNATKIIGDNCVPAGHHTWSGTYSRGSIRGEGSVTNEPGGAIYRRPANFTVVDENTIRGNSIFGTFTRERQK